MNPIALYLASGESLYLGAILLLILILLPQPKNSWLARLRMLLIWLSLALTIMACPPFPFWLDILFLLTFAMFLFAFAGCTTVPKWRSNLRLASRILLSFLLILLPALEFPHRLRPTLTGTSSDHLVVIGDSLSAGIGPETPWPTVLQQNTGIPVTNFSIPGAQT
ncbi:MAG TPA: hypothetical protein VGN88_13765, partial [Phycisphaerae bacterium]